MAVGAKSGVQQAAYEEGADDVHASATKRRHAAVNVRKAEERIVTRLDENEVAALQEGVTRVIAEYVKAKTASESTRRVECDLTDRQAIQLAAATTAADLYRRQCALVGSAEVRVGVYDGGWAGTHHDQCGRGRTADPRGFRNPGSGPWRDYHGC